MKTKFLVGLFLVFSLTIFSQNITSWEIKWNFYNLRHEGLMMLMGNTGTFRVRVINRNNGLLVNVVDQYVKVKNDDDGLKLQCYNPRTHYGGSYSADNFFLDNDGDFYMMDDDGNWSREISITQIRELSDLYVMKQKYGL